MQNLKRLALFDIDMLYVLLTSIDKEITVKGDDKQPYRVNTRSQRYSVFKKSLTCVCCGLTGSKMALEQPTHQTGSNRAHFNLYAVNENGTLVLMTKDHIRPRSKSNDDTLDNLQTMCSPCNASKKDRDITNDELRGERIRDRIRKREFAANPLLVTNEEGIVTVDSRQESAESSV